MKKTILFICMLITGLAASHAQCGKKSIFTSSKTEYLDASGAVTNAEDEQTVIEITKTDITITPGNHTMKGTIKSDSCNWKKEYVEGKSVIKSVVTDGNGGTKNVTITIEGKNGKVTLLATIDDEADKIIRVTADKFSEMKQ